jgi:hypothetical protein
VSSVFAASERCIAGHGVPLSAGSRQDRRQARECALLHVAIAAVGSAPSMIAAVTISSGVRAVWDDAMVLCHCDTQTDQRAAAVSGTLARFSCATLCTALGPNSGGAQLPTLRCLPVVSGSRTPSAPESSK